MPGELRSRQAEVDRLRRAQMERIREEAGLAQPQYLITRAENCLVADNLERQSVRSLSQAEEKYTRMSKSQPSALTDDEDRDRVHALPSDLPREVQPASAWPLVTLAPRPALGRDLEHHAISELAAGGGGAVKTSLVVVYQVGVGLGAVGA